MQKELLFSTREDWLNALVDIFAGVFFNGTFAPKLPPCRFSCGWPKGKAKAIGQCFAAESSADHTYEIFISPEIDDPLRVGDVLLHECIHAAVGLKCKHRGQFRNVALACGLTGRMRDTQASDELVETLKGMTGQIGPYPHAQLVADPAPRRQGNRHLKLRCNNGQCGMIVQTTRIWLDQVGTPLCRCGGEFEESE